jgi:hypothetical protein
MLDPLVIHVENLGTLEWIVVTDRLDEAAVPRRARVCHYHPIKGPLLGAHALESNLHCH